MALQQKVDGNEGFGHQLEMLGGSWGKFGTPAPGGCSSRLSLPLLRRRRNPPYVQNLQAGPAAACAGSVQAGLALRRGMAAQTGRAALRLFRGRLGRRSVTHSPAAMSPGWGSEHKKKGGG